MLSPPSPILTAATPTPTQASAARSSRDARPALLLTAAAGVALALLAGVMLLALQLHFEAIDRSTLQRHLERTRQLLARVDNTGALSALPAEMAAAFGRERDLAVRLQGPLGQPLYEQAPEAAMPAALLAHPSPAHPAPLVRWRAAGQFWRGSALVMRMPMDGAAPLTVAMALNVQQHEAFVYGLQLALLGYVLLATLALGLLAHWLLRRPD